MKITFGLKSFCSKCEKIFEGFALHLEGEICCKECFKASLPKDYNPAKELNKCAKKLSK